MRAADTVRAVAREIFLLALIVVLLLAALGRQQPGGACSNTQVETRP